MYAKSCYWVVDGNSLRWGELYNKKNPNDGIMHSALETNGIYSLVQIFSMFCRLLSKIENKYMFSNFYEIDEKACNEYDWNRNTTKVTPAEVIQKLCNSFDNPSTAYNEIFGSSESDTENSKLKSD